jgi:HSP20 family molecular chaperone IbpA
MTRQSVSRAASEKSGEVPQKKPTIVDAQSLSARMKEVYETVKRRAYGFFEGRGYQGGHDVEDWLRAESELLCPVPFEIKESNDQLTVLAEVAGFGAQEIEVSAEPQRLFISGRKEHALEKSDNEAVYMKKEVDELFRAVDLPTEVDTSNVAATLEDGRLKIVLPKTIIKKAAQAD